MWYLRWRWYALAALIFFSLNSPPVFDLWQRDDVSAALAAIHTFNNSLAEARASMDAGRFSVAMSALKVPRFRSLLWVVGYCGLLWVVVGCCGLLWVVVGCCCCGLLLVIVAFATGVVGYLQVLPLRMLLSFQEKAVHTRPRPPPFTASIPPHHPPKKQRRNTTAHAPRARRRRRSRR